MCYRVALTIQWPTDNGPMPPKLDYPRLIRAIKHKTNLTHQQLAYKLQVQPYKLANWLMCYTPSEYDANKIIEFAIELDINLSEYRKRP